MLICRSLIVLINLSTQLVWPQAIAAVGLQPPSAEQTQYGVSMGTVTVMDEQLYRISLRPDIPLGKMGVAFDLELFIDENGDFSDRGWAFGGSTEVLDTILRKIYYVRYGRPDDDAYVRVGALDRVTLGYGLIVDGYRNTLHYPGVKKTGLEFGFRNVTSAGLSIEGMVNNLQDLSTGGGLVGFRVSAKTAGKLDVGLTYVVDMDQYGGLLDRDDDGFPDDVDAFPENGDRALDNDRDGVADEADADDDNDGRIDVDAGSGLPEDVINTLEELEASHGEEVFAVDRSVSRRSPFNKDLVGRDMFSIVGLDVGYPLVESGDTKLILYGQLALMLDDEDELSAAAADSQGVTRGNRKAEGFGIMAPGLWLSAGPFEGRAEYRYFQDDFDAGYFDNLYELDRARLDVATGKATPKDAELRRGESVHGLFGRIGTDLYGLVEAYADYQHLVGSDDPKRQSHAAISLSRKLLDTIPRLTIAEAYYQKNNIGSRLDEDGTPGSEDDLFESTEDTFYGHRVGFEMANGVSLVWDTRYLFEREADGKLKRGKVMSIETVFSF